MNLLFPHPRDRSAWLELYSEELSRETGRSPEDIVSRGLFYTDFKYSEIDVEFEADTVNLKDCSFVHDLENKVLVVFTEHIGTLIFPDNVRVSGYRRREYEELFDNFVQTEAL